MATITQAQTVGIVELYIAFFGRAPEHSGLEFWKAELSASLDANVDADTAMNTIADRFYDAALQYSEQTGYRADAAIADFVDETYSNVLLRTGDMAPNATEKAYWVEKAGAEGLSRGELVREMISEAKAFAGDPEFGYIVARLNNRTEVGLEFAEEENSGNLSGVEAITAGQTALAGVDETDASVDAAISAFAGPPSGTVIDGKVAGATVGIDVNGDGEISDGEPTVTTDAQGNYEFPDGTPRGTVIASGGTDISTGLAFEGELTAPSGSDVVSPLTTLIDRIAKSDTDPNKTQAEKVADAQTQLKALLGLEDIDADLTEFDVVTETSENDPSGSDGLSDGNALRLYAASVKLMNVIEQGAAAIEGAGNVDGKTAFKAMVDALSGELRSGSGPVDLNSGDSQTIINAINGAASQTLDAEGQAKVAGIAGSAAKIAAAGNTEVDNAVNALGAGDPVNPNDPDSGSTINDALVSIVKSQKAVQGDGADQIRQGAQNGEDGADAADDFSDGNGGINDDVQDNQNVGDVNGDGQDDDGQDGSENDGGDTGGGQGGSTPPAPDPTPEEIFLARWEDLDAQYYAFDDRPDEDVPGQNTEINNGFIELANDYVDYLNAGNEAILDVIQQKEKNADGDYVDDNARHQTFHDNVLGNIADPAYNSSRPRDDIRSDAADEFADRPISNGKDGDSGTDGYQPNQSLTEAAAWDYVHEVDRADYDTFDMAELAAIITEGHETEITLISDGSTTQYSPGIEAFEAAGPGDTIIIGDDSRSGFDVVPDGATYDQHLVLDDVNILHLGEGRLFSPAKLQLTITNSKVFSADERLWQFTNENGDVVLQDNEFYSRAGGLHIQDGTFKITGNTFDVAAGLTVLSGGNTITGNIFNLTDGTGYWGVQIYGNYDGNEITGNTFNGEKYAFRIESSADDVGAEIHGNVMNGLLVNNLSEAVFEIGQNTIHDVVYDNGFFGGVASDVIEGTTNNDYIDGGDGSDTVTYDGDRGDFEITENDDGTVTITSGDWQNRLSNVEEVEFRDTSITLPIDEQKSEVEVADIAQASVGEEIWNGDGIRPWGFSVARADVDGDLDADFELALGAHYSGGDGGPIEAEDGVYTVNAGEVVSFKYSVANLNAEDASGSNADLTNLLAEYDFKLFIETDIETFEPADDGNRYIELTLAEENGGRDTSWGQGGDSGFAWRSDVYGDNSEHLIDDTGGPDGDDGYAAVTQNSQKIAWYQEDGNDDNGFEPLSYDRTDTAIGEGEHTIALRAYEKETGDLVSEVEITVIGSSDVEAADSLIA